MLNIPEWSSIIQNLEPHETARVLRAIDERNRELYMSRVLPTADLPEFFDIIEANQPVFGFHQSYFIVNWSNLEDYSAMHTYFQFQVPYMYRIAAVNGAPTKSSTAVATILSRVELDIDQSPIMCPSIAQGKLIHPEAVVALYLRLYEAIGSPIRFPTVLVKRSRLESFVLAYQRLLPLVPYLHTNGLELSDLRVLAKVFKDEQLLEVLC